MKKSYHSMTVPTTLAPITCLSDVLCPSCSPPSCSTVYSFPCREPSYINLRATSSRSIVLFSPLSLTHLRCCRVGRGRGLHQCRPLLDRLDESRILREPSALPGGRRWRPGSFSGVDYGILDEQIDDAAPQVDLYLIPLLDQREGTAVGRFGHYLADDQAPVQPGELSVGHDRYGAGEAGSVEGRCEASRENRSWSAARSEAAQHDHVALADLVPAQTFDGLVLIPIYPRGSLELVPVFRYGGELDDSSMRGEATADYLEPGLPPKWVVERADDPLIRRGRFVEDVGDRLARHRDRARVQARPDLLHHAPGAAGRLQLSHAVGAVGSNPADKRCVLGPLLE